MSNMTKKDDLLRSLNLGIDIEDISRFEKLEVIRDKKFLAKIFTPKELKYCFSKKNKAEHLAARFSAKEALLKAFAYFNILHVGLNQFEIINDRKGRPGVFLNRALSKRYSAKVSLSHCGDKAIAIAVVAGGGVK